MFTLLNDPENQTPDFDSFRLLCRLIEKNMRIHINSMKWLPTFYLFDSSAQIRMCISALSDLFVLDNLCHRLNHGLPDEVSFPNGQKFDLVGMALLGVPAHLPDLLLLQKKLAELKYDKFDHACLKVLLFFDSSTCF